LNKDEEMSRDEFKKTYRLRFEVIPVGEKKNQYTFKGKYVFKTSLFERNSWILIDWMEVEESRHDMIKAWN